MYIILFLQHCKLISILVGMDKFIIRQQQQAVAVVDGKKRKVTEDKNEKENNPSSSQMKKTKRSVTFREEYADIPFIRSSNKGDCYAFCACCSLHFSISHGGRDDISKHTNTAKHKTFVEDAKKNTSLGNFVTTRKDDHSVIRAEVIFTKVGVIYFLCLLFGH